MTIPVFVTPFSAADARGFIALSRSEYGNAAWNCERHVLWKHVSSPFGPSYYVQLKTDSAEVVGRAMAQPRPMHWGDRLISAAWIMDVVIAREHRSPPTNFLALIKQARGISGVDVTLHTSNEKTYPLYTRLLRFPQPLSLQGYGLPVRLSKFVGQLVPGACRCGFEWLAAPWRWLLGASAAIAIRAIGISFNQRLPNDIQLSDWSHSLARKGVVHCQRDQAFLKWRFVDAPLWPAAVWEVSVANRSLGYIVTRQVEMDGLAFTVLLDFLFTADCPAMTHAAVGLWLARKAIKSGSDAVFAMANPDSPQTRKCIGFPLFRIPDRLLPHATPIFVRSGTSEGFSSEMARTAHITLGDLDYF